MPAESNEFQKGNNSHPTIPGIDCPFKYALTYELQRENKPDLVKREYNKTSLKEF